VDAVLGSLPRQRLPTGSVILDAMPQENLEMARRAYAATSRLVMLPELFAEDYELDVSDVARALEAAGLSGS
jgi:hypothetical protein